MSVFSRKTGASIAATTLIAAIALAGCSSDTSSDADSTASTDAPEATTAESAEGSEDRGPITFAMGKNDTDKIIPVIERWNEANPDEQVTLNELAGEADAQRETLVQSLQAGNSDYDVMALDVIWTADFAANQWLAPLEGDLEVDTSALLDATVESATYNDTLYALPQNTNGQLLFRNTEIVPEAPENWADLVESCGLAEEAGVDCLTLQLKPYEGLAVNTAGFVEGWGGSILDDGNAAVDSDEAKAGIQAMVDGYADGTISQGSLAATEEETNMAFTEGETAYAINWPYMYTNGEAEGSAIAGNFEVQPLVGEDSVGVSTLGGYNNGININSEHKATARDFMEFIVNEENQTWFADNSFPPVLASIYDDEALVEQYPYLPALKESLENASPRPVSPFYPAISKAIQDNAYAAINGDVDVDQATADMKAAIENASR